MLDLKHKTLNKMPLANRKKNKKNVLAYHKIF